MVNGATVEWADGELERAGELKNRLYGDCQPHDRYP